MMLTCGATRSQRAPAPLCSVRRQRRPVRVVANASSSAQESARSARAAVLRETLLSAAAALGPGALLPAWQAGGAGGAAERRRAEEALAELLTLAAPAAPGPAAALEGAWELVYATRGTVVTRALQGPELPLPFPRPAVSRVVQTLTPAPLTPGALAADNAACVDLGPLGTWRLRALGTWTPQAGPASAAPRPEARVAFDAFALEAVAFAGAALEGRLPPLRVPLPPPLAARAATFRTLYLDHRLRVAEGADSGSRFVFTRAAPERC